jgi:hypothetical protein
VSPENWSPRARAAPEARPSGPAGKSGDRVYVELHSGERLIKVARKQRGGWVLESFNQAFEARFVTDDEIGTMHKIAYAREL